MVLLLRKRTRLPKVIRIFYNLLGSSVQKCFRWIKEIEITFLAIIPKIKFKFPLQYLRNSTTPPKLFLTYCRFAILIVQMCVFKFTSTFLLVQTGGLFDPQHLLEFLNRVAAVLEKSRIPYFVRVDTVSVYLHHYFMVNRSRPTGAFRQSFKADL